MTEIPRPIVIHSRPEFLMDLRDFAKRLAADPTAARIGIRIPARDMPDDRIEVEISLGRTGVRLPTYHGWVLDDVSPMAIHRVLVDLVANAMPLSKRSGVHEDAIRRHVAAAVLIAQHDGTLPDDIVVNDGITPTEACLDPDGRLALWLRIPTGHHRLVIDHEELEAILGPMPVPCHVFQIGNPSSPEAYVNVVCPSMNEEEGLDIDVGREDPLESMRIIRDLTEYRQAA